MTSADPLSVAVTLRVARCASQLPLIRLVGTNASGEIKQSTTAFYALFMSKCVPWEAIKYTFSPVSLGLSVLEILETDPVTKKPSVQSKNTFVNALVGGCQR